METLIPRRDLNGLFLFESSNDMHEFITELRDKQKKVVHAALVPKHQLESFKPPYQISELRYHQKKASKINRNFIFF